MDRKFEISPKLSFEWLEDQSRWGHDNKKRMAGAIVQNVRELLREEQELDLEFVFRYRFPKVKTFKTLGRFPARTSEMIPAYEIVPSFGAILRYLRKGLDSEEAVFLSGCYFTNLLVEKYADADQWLTEIEKGERGFTGENLVEEKVLRRQQEKSQLKVYIQIIKEVTLEYAQRFLPNPEKYGEILIHLLFKLPETGNKHGIRERLCQMIREGRIEEVYSRITQHQDKVSIQFWGI